MFYAVQANPYLLLPLKLRNTRMIRILLPLLFLITAAQVNASIIAYDNLDRSGGTPYSGSGFWFGKQEIIPSTGPTIDRRTQDLGTTFTPTASGILESFELGVFKYAPSITPSDTIFMSLYEVIPGSSAIGLSNRVWFESFSDQTSLGFGNTSTYSAANGIMLTAGVEYWLVLNAINFSSEKNNWFSWLANSTGDTSALRYNTQDITINGTVGQNVYLPSFNTLAMSVTVSSVSEPSILLILLSGIIGMMLVQTRSRKAIFLKTGL